MLTSILDAPERPSVAMRRHASTPATGLRQWISLPIESNVRELDARTLLAAVGTESGFGAVLLRIADFGRVVPHLPPTVVLHKDVIGTELIDQSRRYGHVPVALDEEGLVQRDEADYVHRRVSNVAVERCERFLAWGTRHRAAVVAKVPSAADRIIATGNPRTDLLRPALREVYRTDADRLRSRFGRFILVNTNFGTANHRLGTDYVRRHWAAGGWNAGEGREALLESIIRFQVRLLDEFVAMVRTLSNDVDKGTRIVIRPHPSEDHTTWRGKLGHLSNVHVTHEGTVLPWLMACVALVHNGCTTGIEATLLDRPTFAYLPFRNKALESALPNEVSTRVTSREDLMGRLTSLPSDAGAMPDSHARGVLAEHVANLTGRLASEAIAEQLAQVHPGPSRTPTRLLSFHIRTGRASVAVRSYAAATRLGTIAAQRRYDSLLRQTSPSLELARVRAVLKDLQVATGRFRDVQTARLAPDVVAVW